MNEPSDSQTRGQPPLTGPIDIHSHLIPAVDDGCRAFDDTLACVRLLQGAGFVGSICTPHVYPKDPRCNHIEDIRVWVTRLGQRLNDAGVHYQLWPGGELRLYDGVVQWLKTNGVPTLAESRCVLVDFWEQDWPRWVNVAFEWLLGQGYQPILAHPERMACTDVLDGQLAQITDMGVWLQGNFGCLAGLAGYESQLWAIRLLEEGRYHFMAMDVHGADTLGDRLSGMVVLAQSFGQAKLDRLIIDAPRRLILSPGPTGV